MDELGIAKELFGVGGAVSFAIVFGVVVAVRSTAIGEIEKRLIRVEADLKWIKKALGNKEEDE